MLRDARRAAASAAQAGGSPGTGSVDQTDSSRSGSGPVAATVQSSKLVRVAEIGRDVYEHGHARANGKALLAWAEPDVRDAYLRAHPLVRLTEHTITDPELLERELEVRGRGCAYDMEEYAVGVACVAAPLVHDGHVVGRLGSRRRPSASTSCGRR